MLTHPLPRLGAGLFFAFSLTLGATAHAEQFIGFGQPGLPGKWALESFPVFNRTAEGNVRAGGNTVLAYFSETGFTDTTRDQLQFWVGAIPGYASNKNAREASPWGIASPNLGFSYYYNVVEPTSAYGSDDYTTFWTNPTLMVEFPNGNDEIAGYGAFANRYAVSFSLANYLRVGRFAVTFTPAGIHYAARNRNATDFGTGDPQRLRGGVSLWLANVAAGYLVTDDLWLGVHHVYHINNTAASDFDETRVGKIGPSMTYTGFAQQGFYLSANLNFDYYRSANLPRSNELTMALVKFF
ncbi:hypothetical protein A986_16371 [Pseudomonas fluorescens BRIP34879]|uniref:Transporter n=1 Tax=Pseudomonas poae TaxID=200451 RepID=A0ABY0RCP2_9PSED|nr:hypothetical protein [Pseudomonas poae]ELQ15090.1 hypothetical protein A986_16371 [Pseudomonas fluorescens BRIP34879]KRP51197.1 hypothetical protein TU75_10410 [Pseudomonas poae]MBC3198744.1 hypothetical protein [Pseudomonas poae]SDN65515.1 hypothetical protein SAMN04490208_1011 [Pseudomonas poae]